MARPSSRHPTELELEILKILWREGPLTVRQVRDLLRDFRELAATSVITIMNIMVDKGYLTCKKDVRSYIYRTRVTEKATKGRMVGDLLNRVFDGSASAVMMNLIEKADLDEESIRAMRKLLKAKAEEGRR